MKVRIGDVVFEDFEPEDLDKVIEKLQKIGLLKLEGSQPSVSQSPAPRPAVEQPRPSPPSIFLLPESQKEEKKEEDKSKTRGWL